MPPSRSHQKNVITKLKSKILLEKQMMAYKCRVLHLASLALAIRRFRRCREQDQKPKRSFWVRKIFSEKKEERAEWENLFVNLVRMIVNIIASIFA